MKLHGRIEVTIEAERLELMDRFFDGIADVVRLSLPAGVNLVRCDADTFWRDTEEQDNANLTKASAVEENAYRRGFEHARDMYSGKESPDEAAEAYRRGWAAAERVARGIEVERGVLPEVDLKLERNRPSEAEIEAELVKVKAAAVPDGDPTVEVNQRTQKHKPYPDDPTLAEVAHQAEQRGVARYLTQLRPIHDNPQA
jgi:hypothetical protein